MRQATASKAQLSQSKLQVTDTDEEENFEAEEDAQTARAKASFEADAKDVNIEKMIQVPTWKEMLYEMVHAQKLDPWNIDISRLTHGYIKKIQTLKLEDLRIPANIILAASLLLRFKSDSFTVAEESPQATLEEYMGEIDEGQPLTIDALELKSRIPPRRPVTLDELVGAMEEAMQAEKKRETKASEIKVPQIMNIQLPEFDIEEKMKQVYDNICTGARSDAEGYVLFSNLVAGKNAEGTIYTFLPLLHLVQDEKIILRQEDFFQEIFIRLKDTNGKAEKAAKNETEKDDYETAIDETEKASAKNPRNAAAIKTSGLKVENARDAVLKTAATDKSRARNAKAT